VKGEKGKGEYEPVGSTKKVGQGKKERNTLYNITFHPMCLEDNEQIQTAQHREGELPR